MSTEKDYSHLTENQIHRLSNPTDKQVEQGRFQKGVSGNPAGKPKGARNKATLIKEAAARGEGLSPAEMILEISRRAFSQNTMTGYNLAFNAAKEAQKYIEADANTEATKEEIKDMSDAELEKAVLRLVPNIDKKVVGS